MLELHPAGLNVNPDHPHLGVSPDATVHVPNVVMACWNTILLQTPRSLYTSSNWPQHLSSPSWWNNSILKRTLPNSQFASRSSLLWLCVLDTKRNACGESLIRSSRIKTLLFWTTVLPELLTHAIENGETGKKELCSCHYEFPGVHCFCGEDHGHMIACDNPHCRLA